jgi:hypothetical protein
VHPRRTEFRIIEFFPRNESASRRSSRERSKETVSRFSRESDGIPVWRISPLNHRGEIGRYLDRCPELGIFEGTTELCNNSPNIPARLISRANRSASLSMEYNRALSAGPKVTTRRMVAPGIRLSRGRDLVANSTIGSGTRIHGQTDTPLPAQHVVVMGERDVGRREGACKISLISATVAISRGCGLIGRPRVLRPATDNRSRFSPRPSCR